MQGRKWGLSLVMLSLGIGAVSGAQQESSLDDNNKSEFVLLAAANSSLSCQNEVMQKDLVEEKLAANVVVSASFEQNTSSVKVTVPTNDWKEFLAYSGTRSGNQRFQKSQKTESNKKTDEVQKYWEEFLGHRVSTPGK